MVLFRSKKWYVVENKFFDSSSSIFAFVAATQLCRSATRMKTPGGVRYVACHVQVVLLLSFLGPPWCQKCSNCCALGCSEAVSFGCVCLSHVSGWLRCSLWFHLECLAICGVGSGDPLRPVSKLERRQVASTRHSATGCRRVMHAGSCSEGREPVARVHMQMDIIWGFQNKKARSW